MFGVKRVDLKNLKRSFFVERLHYIISIVTFKGGLFLYIKEGDFSPYKLFVLIYENEYNTP